MAARTKLYLIMLTPEIKERLDSISDSDLKAYLTYAYERYEPEWEEIPEDEYKLAEKRTKIEDKDDLVIRITKAANKMLYREGNGHYYRRTGKEKSYMVLGTDMVEYLRQRNII